MNQTELGSVRIVPDRLLHQARHNPNARYFRCGGDWFTFAETEEEARRIAGALAELGVGYRDRVAILLPNCEAYVLLVLALAKLGAIQVPLNVFLKGDFLAHQLADSQAMAIVTDAAGLAEVAQLADLLPELRHTIVVGEAPRGAIAFDALRKGGAPCPSVDLTPRDTIAIMYTSGTTGKSKGCVLSHGYYTFLPRGWFANDWLRPGDHLITPLPSFHIAGQGMAMMGALEGGFPLTMLPAFSASSLLDQAREADATVMFGVGAMGMALLASAARPDDRVHNLRQGIFPPLPPAGRVQFEERFGVPVITEGFGQTECNPVAQSPVKHHSAQPGSIGLPAPWLDIRIVDDAGEDVSEGDAGEIIVRPREPMVMFDGYWRNAEATVAATQDLWFHTGDMARIGEDGRMLFVDRKKDVIRRRGENISSVELEAAIRRHDKVEAVATHGVPSKLGDDEVKAWIVLKPGAELKPGEFFDFLVKALPYFAVPRFVEFIDALPVNALGRLQKFLLRQRDNSGAWDFEVMGFAISKSARRGDAAAGR